MGEPQYKFGQDIPIRFEKLTKENFLCVNDFDCENPSINEFIRIEHKCFDDIDGVTYVFIDENTNTIIGFATLECSGITHVVYGNRKTIPAMAIDYFAVDRKFHHLQYDETDEHYYLSDYMLAMVMLECRKIRAAIGARYIILYAAERGMKLYKRTGFEEFANYMEPDQYVYIDGCCPMYIEIE